ncbi:class I SAM-dependent methyltransferase [Oryzomonas sagensis]|uniref:Class I SAM-dependent methyltransferase n=1 Tax=Oryzomonas sagensis TaxID=2603857 RepID=A0ABQ6TKK3_9BACT|nr:class I SAM-dependent methyltransferase [Oryzomonas sagensis]KAB0668603.1 class I SAM-dependent methyltransferase [Oryzomonas sagensis]
MERKDFDTVASTWDEEPRRVKLAADIGAAIKDTVPLSADWDGMDYGCGTGLLTLDLAPALHSMVGLDSSQGMVDRLTAKCSATGIQNTRAIRCDLEQGKPPVGPFHLVTSAMTLHHIPEIVPLLTSLRGLLHPGGWVALADLETEDGSFHDNPTGVFHHGFSREELEGFLTRAGFTSIAVRRATTMRKGERVYSVLLAVAVNP